MTDRQIMPAQDPGERIKNFKEVTLGFTPQMAFAEASRCLNCKTKPCVAACPVNVDIPTFIGKLKNKDVEGAYETIAESSSLASVCGRVCPQERQCEGSCTLGIKFKSVAIGALERFVADNVKTTKIVKREANNIKIAIVGSGPAGLSCAGDLIKEGYDVTVFEALHKAGGVLLYGIPEFRLPKKIVEGVVENLAKAGVNFETNIVIGKTLSVDELFESGYKAVFIASGAGLPMFMNIPGEGLKGVFSANEFLTRNNLMKAYEKDSSTPVMVPRHAIVVGGGNVAMDAARTAKRLGSDVSVVYRRSMKELPARREEVEHAVEEGIGFNLLSNPVEILSDENGFVKGVKCIQMRLGEPDAQGRRRPEEIPGSYFEIDADAVIMALGTSPNPLIKNTTKGLETTGKGTIVINEDTMTTKPGVFAGGDAVTGAATVISAMGAGKKAAAAIISYLKDRV